MTLLLSGSQRCISADGLNQSVGVYSHLTILIRLQMSFGVITIPHLHYHPLLLMKPVLSMGILEEEEELHHLSQNRLCLGALAKRGNSIFFQITYMDLVTPYRWK